MQLENKSTQQLIDILFNDSLRKLTLAGKINVRIRAKKELKKREQLKEFRV